MNNAINNNVNFTARLRACTKGSKQKWNSISKVFEERTSNAKKDELLVKGSFTEGLEIALNKDNAILTSINLSKGISRKLSKMSVDSVVDKFKTIFNILKREQHSIEKAEKLAKDIRLCTDDIPEKTQNKYWQAVNGAIVKQKQETLAKDPILKNAI